MESYLQNAKVYKRWVNEGRGQGFGCHYQPWLQVHNVPSRGRSHRAFSEKSGRVIHCFSDLEFHAFLLLEWSHAVTDIREQFPLNPDATMRIAEDLGIKHPKMNGELIVMTTDFVATHGDSSHLLAIQVKPSNELNKPRVKEKLAIEQRYWQQLGVGFEVITEATLHSVKVQNIRWILSTRLTDYSDAELCNIGVFWRSRLKDSLPQNLVDFASEIDEQRGAEAGLGLAELRVLFKSRIAKFDINLPYFRLCTNDIEFLNKTSRLH